VREVRLDLLAFRVRQAIQDLSALDPGGDVHGLAGLSLRRLLLPGRAAPHRGIGIVV
jgi:hypothetical protein